MHPLLNIATTAAHKAGTRILRAFDRLETVKISPKAANDVVTDIDILAEKTIIDIVKKAYPSHGILAEESGHQPGDDYLWIIDPIDGTLNFTHGIPHFAISIAVQYKGRIEHGVVYDPIRQEIFSASRGAGAKLNQYRLRVNPLLTLNHAIIATGIPTEPAQLQHALATINAVAPLVSDVRIAGSAALNLAYVAAGRLHAYWEFGLKSWDIAAGALLVTEAGGLVCEPNGNNEFLTSGNILAANPTLMEEMLRAIALKN